LSLAWAVRPQVVGSEAALYVCRTESLQVPCNASYFGFDNIYFPVPSLYAVVEATTTAIENLSVVCTIATKSIAPIENGVMVGPMMLEARKDKVFELRVVPSAMVECVTNSSSTDAKAGGEVDLFFRLDEPLDITVRSRANCSAETSLSYETCSLAIPNDSNSSSLFVTLIPFDGAVNNVTLVCKVNVTEPLLATGIITTPPVVPVSTMEQPVPASDAPVASSTDGGNNATSASSSSIPTAAPTSSLLLLLVWTALVVVLAWC
jgi:hypothetical protein